MKYLTTLVVLLLVTTLPADELVYRTCGDEMSVELNGDVIADELYNVLILEKFIAIDEASGDIARLLAIQDMLDMVEFYLEDPPVGAFSVKISKFSGQWKNDECVPDDIIKNCTVTIYSLGTG